MSASEFVAENLGLILGVLAFAVFVVGLMLALRTEGGRNTLAGGAVRVALAALALAERWLSGQMQVETQTALETGDTAQEHEIEAARRWLKGWQARR
jgi:hypothetical protein